MQFVTKLRILVALTLVSWFTTTANGEQLLLKGDSHPQGFQRIKQKVDVTGHLNLDPHGKGVTKVPVTIAASVDFQQRYLNATDRVRHYRTATADIQFGEGESAKSHVPVLRDARRTVCLTTKAGTDTYFAPTGSLTREELELIDTPLCRLDLVELLPGKKVAVGDSWSHASTTMARMLNLDTVGVNEVESTLDSITDGKATISMKGTIDGAVGGVATEIELKAKYVFDSKTRRIGTLSLAFSEKRDIAPAEPGFEVVTQLAMAEAAIGPVEELSDDRLANLDLRKAGQSGWLHFTSTHGGYRLLHDARWRTLLDEQATTIFRFVDDGQLIAQANLSRMPRSEVEASLTLEGFSEQVGNALADNLGQLMESKQYESREGHRVMRVEASGVISEVPMRWVYYHVSTEQGLRVAAIVTVEEKLIERFAGADNELINALELVPVTDDGKEPQPAKTAAKPTDD